MNNPNLNTILGGVLAGGLSRRMGGGDKSLAELDGTTLINRVVKRLEPQVASIVINANGDPQRFSPTQYRIVQDVFEGFAGPLAGIHALLEFAARSSPNISHVATVAADTPFFPENFVDKCAGSLVNQDQGNSTIILAKSDQNRHPVFGLWPVSLCSSLAKFLKSGDTRKVMAFVQMHPYKFVEFPYFENNGKLIDPFFNINAPDDLEKALSIVRML
jgi:molybdopterin-guanine dinucleotide biosynthesis protein A